MSDEQVLVTKELRMRVTQLEYQFNNDSKNISEKEFVQEIERIYLEETGEQIPAEIKIYTSSEAKTMKNDKSGYDGTALYFSSEEERINEVYIVSQGSQGLEDWSYNIESMLAGKNYSQAEKTHDFTVEALAEFGYEFKENSEKPTSVPVIGLSHSLAHNNNISAYLVFNTFSKVHSVNGAQTNYYQLFDADDQFENQLKDAYPVLKYDPDAIYSLPPAELEAIAKDFYADKAENIYQDISKNDMLYAVSGTRGFFELGHVDYHVTSEEHQGLRKLVDKIPDDAIVPLQKLAIDYTVAKENGSMNDVINDLTGVNMAIVEQFDGIWGSVKTYLGDDFTGMVSDVNEKLPDLLQNVQLITKNADVIFDEIMNANYITKSQRDELVEVFTDIETELLTIQAGLKSLEDNRNMDMTTSHAYMGALGADIGAGAKVYLAAKRLIDLFGQLNKDEYEDILEMIVTSHGIPEMINTLGKGEKSYLNGDLLMAPSGGGGGRDIWVNISAALRMYTEGKAVLEERTEEISRIEGTVEQEITQNFENKKRQLIDKINDMEENSSSYTSMVQKHTANTVKGVQRITVNDQITTSLGLDHEPEIRLLNLSVTDSYKFIEKYRESIESMFDEEAKVAERFSLAEVVFDD